MKQQKAFQKAKPGNELQQANRESSPPAPPDAARAEHIANINKFICDATGTRSKEFGNRIISLLQVLQLHPPQATEGERWTDAVSAMAEMKPSNATEALLATQMLGVHEAVVRFMERAFLAGQTMAGVDANVLRSTRLMRLFLDQIETFQKLKGKAGQQKVIVEHVHVNEGGQAIVGAVTANGGQGRGAGDDNGTRTP